MKRVVFFIFFIFLNAALPDYYYKIKDIKKQKRAFIDIMLPLIQNENRKILVLRKKILKIFADPFYMLNIKDLLFLAKVAREYKIKSITDKEEFLKKIDTIPPSLALAQAAIESAWGKSRFARLANNIYGHWEYSDKGLKPKSKYDDINITYSIKIFPSIEDSIKAYMLNLNRNRAYRLFREKRYDFRKKGKIFTGIEAAKTLKNYSQLKEEYVKRLITLIKVNDLLKYDKGK